MAELYPQGYIENVFKENFGQRFKKAITVKDDKDPSKTKVIDDLVKDDNDKNPVWSKRIHRKGFGQTTEGDFPEFLFNQFELKDFYNNMTESPLYKGLFESIGRATIHAMNDAPNPFAQFIQEPLDYGSAVYDGVVMEVNSRPWIKHDPSNGADVPLMFKGLEAPEVKNSVAKCLFRREIPLVINKKCYDQFALTGGMVTDFAGALAGTTAYCYTRDMYEAAKEYFLGILRIDKEPLVTTEGALIDETTLSNNKMCLIIKATESEQKDTDCMADRFQSAINNVIRQEFKFPSRLYNPTGKETSCNDMCLIMEAKYQYPFFLEYFAKIYHPEKVDIGPTLQQIWIDDIEKKTKEVYPSNFKLIGMIVDPRALGIVPVTPYSVSTFMNPQQDAVYLYAHYEIIFKMLPFYNRKYIFIQTVPKPSENTKNGKNQI